MDNSRKDFPLLHRKVHDHPLIYFDNAATTHKPKAVIDAVSHFYEHDYGTVHRAIYSLAANSTSLYEEAREKFRGHLNAERVEEIIFTRGTTEAINLVAHSFSKAFLKRGDNIIITETEHHANIVPWQLVCEERGANLFVIPVNDAGELDLKAFEKLLTPRTKLVALAHISNSLGVVHPIEEVVRLAHDNGSKVLIDGAQAAPHMKIDVQKLDADFYAFSGHKMYGPTGIGVLYGKLALLEAIPPFMGGGDMIEMVTFPKTTYQKPPLKFEAGTPMIAQAVGLAAALDYLNGVGLEAIDRYEQQLTQYALEKLQTIEEVEVLGPKEKRAPIIGFRVPGVHPLDLGTLLDLNGVALRTGHLCAQPTMNRFDETSLLRISFSFYNTKEEIDAFVEYLSSHLSRLYQA